MAVDGPAVRFCRFTGCPFLFLFGLMNDCYVNIGSIWFEMVVARDLQEYYNACTTAYTYSFLTRSAVTLYRWFLVTIKVRGKATGGNVSKDPNVPSKCTMRNAVSRAYTRMVGQ